MITEAQLIEIGFTKNKSPYTGREMWYFGTVEETDVLGDTGPEPIIRFDPESQNAITVRSQFTIIERKCETHVALVEFVRCIQFLYPELKDKLVLWFKGGTNDN